MHYGALLHTSGGAPWFLKNNLYLEFIMIENKNNTPRRPTAQTVSAFMLLAGIALNFCSFFTPPRGELTESVVAFMGEALIYAASVFGLTAYVDAKLKKLRNEKD